jgi:hypothetical protein
MENGASRKAELWIPVAYINGLLSVTWYRHFWVVLYEKSWFFITKILKSLN